MKNDQRPPVGDKDKRVFRVDFGKTHDKMVIAIVEQGMWVTPEGELVEGYRVLSKILGEEMSRVAPKLPIFSHELKEKKWEFRAQLHKDEIDRYRERIRKQGEKSVYEKIFSSVAWLAYVFLIANGIRMLIEWSSR